MTLPERRHALAQRLAESSQRLSDLRAAIVTARATVDQLRGALAMLDELIAQDALTEEETVQ